MRTSVAAAMLILLAATASSGRAGAADEKAEKAFAAAEAKMREGQAKEAVAQYRAFAAKFPADKRCAQARYTCAFLLHKKLGQLEDARTAYQEVIKHHPKNVLARDAQFHIAETYEQDGDEQKALQAYEDFLKSDTENTRTDLAKRKIDNLRKRGGKRIK
jgi:TolA-binding protein